MTNISNHLWTLFLSTYCLNHFDWMSFPSYSLILHFINYSLAIMFTTSITLTLYDPVLQKGHYLWRSLLLLLENLLLLLVYLGSLVSFWKSVYMFSWNASRFMDLVWSQDSNHCIMFSIQFLNLLQSILILTFTPDY